jgi:hypothetical protein
MILRSLPKPHHTPPNGAGPVAAWDVFLESQKRAKPPCAIIFQAEHSKLAGDLAEALLPEVFGEFPRDVIQAIGQHDFGWNASDQSQIESLGQAGPRPFPSLSTEETLPSWHNSIAHARSIGPLVDVLVSRHFTLLGAVDPARADFVRIETERRREVERVLSYAPAELDRWIGALGFCDLLSLYLCCGSQQPAKFSLAHPADPTAAHARKITLSFENGLPRFSPPVLKPDTHFAMTVRNYAGPGVDLSPLTLKWRFVYG